LSPAEFPAKPVIARQEPPVPQRLQSLFAAETGVRSFSLEVERRWNGITVKMELECEW